MDQANNSDQRRLTRLSIAEQHSKDHYVRRSTRETLGLYLLDRSDVKTLLKRIKTNHKDSIVLKIKDQIIAEITSAVFDAIIQALWKNTKCQALYIQNLSKAIDDEQLRKLVNLLKKKMIWCINIGETYEVSNEGWRFFCDSLSQTYVTHLYVSEHVISMELKNKMRDHIRENRKKHDLHCAFKNLRIIERCTNMWWNPINGVKELKPPPPTPPPESESEEDEDEFLEEEVKPIIALTPAHTAYWQEGLGEGGSKPWKFKCICGETCSSYENYRYHPIGRMFECSNPMCCKWSHVNCVLGSHVTDEDLAKIKNVLCGSCKSKSRLLSKYTGVKSIVDLYTTNTTATTTTNNTTTNTTATTNTTTTQEAKTKSSSIEKEDGVGEEEKPWTFKCKCGEVCSSYENARYHPAGQWFECSQCSVWSHVICVIGPHITPKQVSEMKMVLCFSCATKNRRNHRIGGIEINTMIVNTNHKEVVEDVLTTTSNSSSNVINNDVVTSNNPIETYNSLQSSTDSIITDTSNTITEITLQKNNNHNNSHDDQKKNDIVEYSISNIHSSDDKKIALKRKCDFNTIDSTSTIYNSIVL